jgi:hypothetical protein
MVFPQFMGSYNPMGGYLLVGQEQHIGGLALFRPYNRLLATLLGLGSRRFTLDSSQATVVVHQELSGYFLHSTLSHPVHLKSNNTLDNFIEYLPKSTFLPVLPPLTTCFRRFNIARDDTPKTCLQVTTSSLATE